MPRSTKAYRVRARGPVISLRPSVLCVRPRRRPVAWEPAPCVAAKCQFLN